eukprot:scaffold2575_cov17-Tisochrysis_lutea.AAC.3
MDSEANSSSLTCPPHRPQLVRTSPVWCSRTAQDDLLAARAFDIKSVVSHIHVEAAAAAAHAIAPADAAATAAAPATAEIFSD